MAVSISRWPIFTLGPVCAAPVTVFPLSAGAQASWTVGTAELGRFRGNGPFRAQESAGPWEEAVSNIILRLARWLQGLYAASSSRDLGSMRIQVLDVGVR